MEIEAKLQEQFVNNQIAYGIANDEFNYRRVNKLYDGGQEILRLIWRTRGGGLLVLDGLSMHREPYVALGAAVGLLPVNEEIALKKLHELEESNNSNVAYNARMCISEWKKGGMRNIRDIYLEESAK